MKTPQDPRSWSRIDQVLRAALDLPADERGAFVAQACDADQNMQDAVLRLLAYSEQPSPLETSGRAFRDELIHEAAGEWDRLAADAIQIDRYRLLRELGRGGMGTVYLAERDDGSFEQRAAVKVLRRGLGTDHILERFRSERQILASLDHPSIARLLDGGATADGRPYLVMELVEGESITDYCASRQLGVEQRLRLLIAVGRALEHAHRKLVVHRDIKPSNILVTATGSPKLLDFGIAKVLDPLAGAVEARATAENTRFMTPQYASPEQLLGQPVTTATDVYQLGLLLYVLLAGRHPFEPTEAGRDLRRLVLEQVPVAPSKAASSAGANPHQSGRHGLGAQPAARRADLDAIVLMAICKEPERRYASVAALVEDLERHLQGRPVVAMADSWRYRTRKFCGRHRAGMVAASGTLMLVVAFVAGLVTYAVRLDRALAEANVQRETVEETMSFLTGLFGNSGEARADLVTARTLLARGAERVRTDLAGKPEVLANMLTTLGEIHLTVGAPAQAQPLLDDALALQRTLYVGGDDRLAQALYRRGHFLVGMRSFAEAEPHLTEAVAILERRGAGSRLELGQALASLAAALKESGDPKSAEHAARRAIALLEGEGVGQEDAVEELQIHLAGILRRQERGLEAEALYRQVLARTHAHTSRAASQARNDLAYQLSLRGEYPEAEQLYRQALAMETAAYGESSRKVSVVTGNLATVLTLEGRHDEAIALRRSHLLALRGYLQPDHWRIGSALGALGTSYLEAGRPADAEPVLLESVALYRSSLGPAHTWTLRACARAGKALTALDRHADAEAMLRPAYLLALEGEAKPDRVEVIEELRVLLEQLHRTPGEHEAAARPAAGAHEGNAGR